MPGIIRKLRSDYIWKIPTDEKVLYLTFDDGPNITVTPFVLDELRKYNAKATFFCIGKNVEQQPELYQRILNEGHVCGNHSHNHLNGYKTGVKPYVENVEKAAQVIDTFLYRPPYGRIKRLQAKMLQKNLGYNIIMWHILSGDFDTEISGEKCLMNVLKNAVSGSVIVFHDSDKAFVRLQYALPKVLKHFHEQGYRFQAITKGTLQIAGR